MVTLGYAGGWHSANLDQNTCDIKISNNSCMHTTDIMSTIHKLGWRGGLRRQQKLSLKPGFIGDNILQRYLYANTKSNRYFQNNTLSEPWYQKIIQLYIRLHWRPPQKSRSEYMWHQNLQQFIYAFYWSNFNYSWVGMGGGRAAKTSCHKTMRWVNY